MSESKKRENAPAAAPASGAKNSPAQHGGDIARALAKESGGLYKLLVDTILDYAIFALDAAGNVITWNAGAERFKGYRAEEIIGKHFSVFYTEEDLRAHKPEKELIEAEAVGCIEDEGWRVRKDGSRFWANVIITALKLNGELIGFAKVTRDLTERRAAEEKLRASEGRFRLLVQGVRDYGIFMLDPSGKVASWNEGAERIKGYSAGEIIGKHFSTFYPQSDIDAGKPAHELEVAARVGSYEDEGWRVRKDGTQFWSNVIITAVRDKTGRLLGFSKVTRDLSERRAGEERAIEDARRVASSEAANKTKAEFLQTMSHELRTPLNAIGGYADLLLLGVTGEMINEQRDYLERIRRSQQHLLGIINDLLNFTRIEAGRIAYDMSPMSLGETIRRVLPMIKPQTKDRGLSISVVVDADLFAVADHAKVEQILLNLLSNAIKFTKSGGSITIRQFRRDDCVGIRVDDTGIGIPAANLETIFEPFVQIGRTFVTGHEGTGLGLAISRDLARAMGGDVTARSETDVGSTFEILLKAEETPD